MKAHVNIKVTPEQERGDEILSVVNLLFFKAEIEISIANQLTLIYTGDSADMLESLRIACENFLNDRMADFKRDYYVGIDNGLRRPDLNWKNIEFDFGLMEPGFKDAFEKIVAIKQARPFKEKLKQ